MLNDLYAIRQNCSAYIWKQLEALRAYRACTWLLACTEIMKACWSHWDTEVWMHVFFFSCTKVIFFSLLESFLYTPTMYRTPRCSIKRDIHVIELLLLMSTVTASLVASHRQSKLTPCGAEYSFSLLKAITYR